jgi:hypothetical protein
VFAPEDPSMSKSPVATVKDKFGDKAKLAAAVAAFAKSDLWVERTNKNKGLERVSNAKLLRLHATLSDVKERFGTRAKLIDAICELEKRSKDAGYKKRLEAHPVPRLYDAWRSAARRAGVAVPKAAPAKAEAPKPKADAAPKAKPAAKPAAKPKAAPKAAKKA